MKGFASNLNKNLPILSSDFLKKGKCSVFHNRHMQAFDNKIVIFKEKDNPL